MFPPVIPTDARQEQHPRDHPQAFPQHSASGDHRVTNPSAQGCSGLGQRTSGPVRLPDPRDTGCILPQSTQPGLWFLILAVL